MITEDLTAANRPLRNAGAFLRSLDESRGWHLVPHLIPHDAGRVAASHQHAVGGQPGAQVGDDLGVDRDPLEQLIPRHLGICDLKVAVQFAVANLEKIATVADGQNFERVNVHDLPPCMMLPYFPVPAFDLKSNECETPERRNGR